MTSELPRMYTELADWFHLITAPEEYVEEADFYLSTMAQASGAPIQSLLELGSGGGNNAFHYKRRVSHVVLSDLSAGMLRVSEGINPECEHVQGDMRSLRLGRTFDAIFVHDAVCYLTTSAELCQAMETAFVHCRAGGVALFAPDHVRENFRASTDCGGNDASGRGARYLEWTHDPDTGDSTYAVDYAYLLRDGSKATRIVQDRHVCGLFSRTEWLELLNKVGFAEASGKRFDHSELPAGSLEVFVAKRPS